MDFTALPDDVYYCIFSFMSLVDVLKMEHVCKRLKSSARYYLSTLKSIDLFGNSIKNDIFGEWREEVKITPSLLLLCLKRCPRAKFISYLPGPTNSRDSSYSSMVSKYIKQHPNIEVINFVNSKKLLDEFLAHEVEVGFSEVHLVLNGCPLSSSVSIPQLCSGSLTSLYLEDITIDPAILKLLPLCHEMQFVRCLLTSDSRDSLKALQSLSSIQKFVHIEEPGNPASSQAFSQLLSAVVKSDSLRVLHLGLTRFSVLEEVVVSQLAGKLQDLGISSAGTTYSTALQQIRYAPVVAEICQKCKGTLERICLPSSILVKQFFELLISRGCLFPNLKTLDVTGIADTKMFLVPGNSVGAFYYEEFLKLCPQIRNLSLRSFSASLNAITLPVTLCSLVLPWDGRLNSELQKNDIERCVAFLPNLLSLSIFGVEEIKAILQDCQSSLEFSLCSLREFKIKNVCLKHLNLKNCTNLTLFSIHCCPASVVLPVESLKSIKIYTSDFENLVEFMTGFMLAKNSFERKEHVSCHIHAQLHSIYIQQEPLLTGTYEVKSLNLLPALQKTLSCVSKGLDYWVLKDDVPHILEHNSGEEMYPLTEYSSHSTIASARSKTDIIQETCLRARIFEGVQRWKDIISHLKSAASSSSSLSGPSKTHSFDTIFCDRLFKCLTNLDMIAFLNSDSNICQASGHCIGTSTIQTVARDAASREDDAKEEFGCVCFDEIPQLRVD